MDIQTTNQRKPGIASPKKLYTQREVDDLLEIRQSSLPSRATQIKQET